MIEGQEGVSWEQWLALARTAEEAGIEALFRSDHYTSGLGHGEREALDAWTTLAALAAVTERIRFGTLVSPVTFRHPSLLARAVATVDHISGGRVELGMGTGWMELEHEAYGFPFPPYDERLAELREQVEIVHRQWTEEAFDFEGERYRLQDARARPRPVQQPHPPLIIGGQGKRRSVAVAARWADEYNTFGHDADTFRAIRRRLDEALGDEGREPASVPLSAMVGFVLGRDAAEVDERLRAFLARVGRADMDPAEFLAARAGRFQAGTVDEVAAGLRRFEAAGVERVFMQHLLHDDLDTVRLIGHELAPALA